MEYDEIKGLYDAVIQAAECIVKELEELGKAVYEAVTAVCESVYKTFTALDIQKLIEQIKADVEKQEPKYDKNISHFKHISKPYNQPYYKIRPTARTHCR